MTWQNQMGISVASELAYGAQSLLGQVRVPGAVVLGSQTYSISAHFLLLLSRFPTW